MYDFYMNFSGRKKGERLPEKVHANVIHPTYTSPGAARCCRKSPKALALTRSSFPRPCATARTRKFASNQSQRKCAGASTTPMRRAARRACTGACAHGTPSLHWFARVLFRGAHAQVCTRGDAPLFASSVSRCVQLLAARDATPCARFHRHWPWRLPHRFVVSASASLRVVEYHALHTHGAQCAAPRRPVAVSAACVLCRPRVCARTSRRGLCATGGRTSCLPAWRVFVATVA
jgi:hypothetical protein